MIMMIGFIACLLNLLGWILTVTSDDNKKVYWIGLILLTTSMFLSAGMIIAEVL